MPDSNEPLYVAGGIVAAFAAMGGAFLYFKTSNEANSKKATSGGKRHSRRNHRHSGRKTRKH
jgi:hypothetical protein